MAVLVGTYLGVLTKTIQNEFPDIEVLWVAESDNRQDHIENEGNFQRHYLSRYDDSDNKLDIVKYSKKFYDIINQAVSKILLNDPNAKIVIESPEWEGLLADYFAKMDDPRVLKVSRNHTPLAVTAEMNGINLKGIFAQQVNQEYQQIENSDIVSSPTNYVVEATIKAMWPSSGKLPVPVSVRLFLSDTYGVTGGNLEETSQGLDNTVYFINGAAVEDERFDLVLKIVETKSREEIEASLNIMHSVSHACKDLRF